MNNMRKYLTRVYTGKRSEYCDLLRRDLMEDKKRFVITANAEIIMMAESDEEISSMLLDPDSSIVPDGISVVKACQKAGLPVQERISGIEISEYLLEEADRLKKSIYLFGSKEEVVEALVARIRAQYRGVVIAGYSDGYVADRDAVFAEIQKLQPDICLVAMGVPAQEKLIYKYLGSFEKGVFVGVGGSFDVMSGMKKRAPALFIKLNLEWLYRIAKEPYRLKRFWDNNIKFLFKAK